MLDQDKWIGKKVGHWLILSVSNSIQYSHGYHYYFNCRCECGENKRVAFLSLKSGKTQSCGCVQKEKARQRFKTHGLSKTRTYKIWKHIIARCRRDSDYAGRGIKICEEWNNFENFYKDMGDVPNGLTIDRINNDGNYEPSNCRWANYEQQANNKRNNVFLTYDNRKMSISQWAKFLGVGDYLFEYRRKKGMDNNDMFNEIIQWKKRKECANR